MKTAFADVLRNAGRPMLAPLAGFPSVVLTNSSIAENLTNSALQSVSLTSMHRLVDFDIVFPMMDLTVESEALGAKVNWETDAMPTVEGILMQSMEDIEKIAIPEIGEGNRLNVFVETCALLKKTFPDKLVWAYALGPFSIAGRLMGMTDIAIAVKLEPETVHAVLAKCTQLLVNYANALLDTGVDGLMILEPASSLLRVDDATEFSNTYVKQVVDLVKSRDRTPALHNCGSINHLIESFCETGIEALSVGSVVDVSEVYPRLTEDVVLLGNLDPTEVFLRSTPEEVREQADRLSFRMADCERFILSSGCDLPPGVSVENLKAFESAVRQSKAAVI